MAKIFGGSASRLEVYALFVAAVVLIGGGIGGAIVVTSSDSKPAEVAQVSVDTTVVDTTVVDTLTTTTTTAPAQESQSAAPTTRYVEPPPVTVTPDQPVQDFSAYCTMPNLIGTWALGGNGNPWLHHEVIGRKLSAAGCGVPVEKNWCISDSVPLGFFRIVSQDPAPGTLVHRSLGTASIRVEHSSASYGPGQQPVC
jgi:hypothetical protein